MKYIVCSLTPGLNDMLCEIHKCLQYAVRYDRILVIYTCLRSSIIDHCNIIHSHYNNKTVSELCAEYGIQYSSIPLIKDLNKDYPDQFIKVWFVLGGVGSHNMIPYMKYSEPVLSLFRYRYSLIPKPYTSIHIRHTDIRADINQFLKEVGSIISGKTIFLASDNIDIITLFKEKYGNNIYSYTTVIKVEGKGGLHLVERNETDQLKYNIETIVDLLLLAHGSSYLFSCGTGFSRLAEYMFNNKHLLPPP